jgi:hypothetical protein
VRAGGNGSAAEGEHADELEREVAGLRSRLGALIGELGQRRHDAFDVRLQVRRHPVSTILGTALVLGVVGLGVAALVNHRRRARSVRARVVNLRRAIGRLSEPIGRSAPGVGRKLLVAGGSAVASTLGRRLGKSLFGE